MGFVCICCAAQQPETEGGGIPATADEMSELMYKPLLGEWGERSRDEECERIIAGIDQLITVGVCVRACVCVCARAHKWTFFNSFSFSLTHTLPLSGHSGIHSHQGICMFL